MRFLFWNTYRNKDINDLLAEIILENAISVAILAEYEADTADLFQRLYDFGIEAQLYPSGIRSRLVIIGTPENVIAKDQTIYESIQLINNELLLCCVHLPSKLYDSSNNSRISAILRIKGDIQKNEETCKTKNTIIVGDFNMSPYEEECMGFQYLHGLPVVHKGRTSREIAGEEYEFFYNPMWNFLGDFQKPYGTYYYSGSDTFWNIFDQVIIRPALIERFRKEKLMIITRTTTQSLLDSNGLPDKHISDHLPIVFEVEDRCEQI